MRGINISSIIFIIIVIWNIAALSLSGYVKGRSGKSSPAGVLSILIINVILVSLLLYFSINLGVTHYNIKSDKLPAEFDGYKILQISDFHAASFYGGTDRLIEKVIKEKPDIIVLTGDLIDESTKTSMQAVRALVSQSTIIAPVYFVSGNHDVWYEHYSELKDLLSDEGVVLLQNSKVKLKRGTSYINLFGINDPDTWNSTGAKQYLKNTAKELQNDNGSYNILLFHRANMFDTIKGYGFQLILSGHMHGGQVQIPFVGGLISPHKDRHWFPKYTEGKWTEDGTTMIVSRGLGNNISVPRILNPPEIVVVTLKCEL
jgi:predicted MPP superfamily phosphohydrolase